jgi:signal transduction histidine kinase
VAAWSAGIRAAFAGGAEQHAEFALPGPSGERFFRTRIVPEPEGDGTTETVVAVTYDVSERVLAERDREGLLDTLAHDLKNPLAAIKGQAQLLRRQVERRGVPDAADLAERARRFERLADRVTDLVEELSDHARVAAGQPVELRPEPTDLAALVAEAVEETRQAAPGHEVTLAIEAAPLIGDWDPVRLRRVVANLLGNAVKYSPAGGRIAAALGREDGQAVLRVADEGIGIPAADLPHVFGFRRRAGNVGAIAGSGLGLAGARLIVEQHGGTVTAESEEGRGATFTVRLPL